MGKSLSECRRAIASMKQELKTVLQIQVLDLNSHALLHRDSYACQSTSQAIAACLPECEPSPELDRLLASFRCGSPPELAPGLCEAHLAWTEAELGNSDETNRVPLQAYASFVRGVQAKIKQRNEAKLARREWITGCIERLVRQVWPLIGNGPIEPTLAKIRAIPLVNSRASISSSGCRVT